MSRPGLAWRPAWPRSRARRTGISWALQPCRTSGLRCSWKSVTAVAVRALATREVRAPDVAAEDCRQRGDYVLVRHRRQAGAGSCSRGKGWHRSEYGPGRAASGALLGPCAMSAPEANEVAVTVHRRPSQQVARLPPLLARNAWRPSRRRHRRSPAGPSASFEQRPPHSSRNDAGRRPRRCERCAGDRTPGSARLRLVERGTARRGTGRAGHGVPQAIGLAATFDDAVDGAGGHATINDEARAKHHQFLREGAHGRYQGLTFWSERQHLPRPAVRPGNYGEDPYTHRPHGRGLRARPGATIRSTAAGRHRQASGGAGQRRPPSLRRAPEPS